jgi:RNA polymerase sigma-70 factor (ECF subfamily)
MGGHADPLRLGFVEVMNTPPVTDEELARRLTAGRHDAFEALLERYRPFLTNLAARQLGRPAAEDVVQDVLLSVWQHVHTFDPRRGTFRAWVAQITRRRIINEMRRRRSRPQAEPDPDGMLLDRLPHGGPDVADLLAVDERRMAVRRALRLLPQSQRDAVTLAFLDELPH